MTAKKEGSDGRVSTTSVYMYLGARRCCRSYLAPVCFGQLARQKSFSPFERALLNVHSTPFGANVRSSWMRQEASIYSLSGQKATHLYFFLQFFFFFVKKHRDE